ncbi:MAG: BACON domain-containing protein [Bryobacteraceae bacterium]
MQFASSVGGGVLPAQTLSVSSGGYAVNFTAAASVALGSPTMWLSVTPASGTTVANGTVQLQVAANAANLPAGTYNGTITVTPSGGTAVTVSVTLTVGGTSYLWVSNSNVVFDYVTGQQTPTGAQLTLQSNIGAMSFTVDQTYPAWLQISPLSGIFTSGTAYLTITPVVSGCALSVCQATLTIRDSYGYVAYVNVTLNMNATGTVSASPNSLTFTYLPGSTSYPAGQSFVVYGSTAFTVYAYSTGGWLSATQSGSSVYVYVNPTNLTAATYTGYVQISSSSPVATFNVPVTFQVGTGGYGSTVAGPSSLTFSMQQGGVAPPYQTIVVAGGTNSSYTASATITTGNNWLTISPTVGLTPGQITATVNTNATGMAAGNYDATITVTSSLGTMNIPVRLAIASTPVVIPGPGNITLNYQAGSTAPGPQMVQISTSSAATAFNFSATTGTTWLQVQPQVGVTGTNLAIVPSVLGLPVGINSGSVTITATNPSAGAAANSPITIPVVINVYGTQGLSANPASLTFTTGVGGTPAAQTVSISTDVASTYTASITSGGGWLQVTPAYGSTPATLTVQVASATLSAGTYSGNIAVTTQNGTVNIPVTLTVGGGLAGTLSANPLNLSFDYTQGEAAPAAKTVQVSSSGASLTFSATASTNWITATPASGSTPATLNVSVSPAGLGAGTYNGTVTITSAGAQGSPQTVNVSLTVRPAPVITVDLSALSFSFRTDGPPPAAQRVQVSSTGAALGFTATSSAAWLVVTPAGGTTPAALTIAVLPAGLAAGRYTGAIQVASTATPASSRTIDVVFDVAGPLPTLTRVTNAASYAENVISPGMVMTLFGENMGPAELARLSLDANGRVAKTAGGVRVLVNGLECPMIYAVANQVSAIVPYQVAGAREASVQVIYQGNRSNSKPVRVATSAPAIFTANASGTGPAAALNQDYSVNSQANGAARGSVLMLFVTGEGQTIPFGEDGKLASGDVNSLPRPVLPVSVTIGGVPANVQYAGAAPGMVAGVMQVNVEVPLAAGTGAQPVVVRVGDASSADGVTVVVK